MFRRVILELILETRSTKHDSLYVLTNLVNAISDNVLSVVYWPSQDMVELFESGDHLQ